MTETEQIVLATTELLDAVEDVKEDLTNKTANLFSELDEKITVGKEELTTIINDSDLYKEVLTLKTTLTEYIERNDIEFMLISNGTRIRYKDDPIDTDASDEGFDLFTPHNREEYELARLYLLALGKPTSMGPLGIYKPTSGGNSKYRRLNSDEMGLDGWSVRDGWPTWWASDLNTVSEPNGDYTANAYLGISYTSDGYVRWYNDAYNRYSYTTYLCVKRK